MYGVGTIFEGQLRSAFEKISLRPVTGCCKPDIRPGLIPKFSVLPMKYSTINDIVGLIYIQAVTFTVGYHAGKL